MKACTKCGESKAYNNFYRQNASRDGYYAWCKDCSKQHSVSRRNQTRNTDLIRKYGITHQDYLDMLDEQEHKCAVCGLPEEKNFNGKLCVDHNHKTGKVRGLLCNPCNKALGLAMDSAEILYNLYKYKMYHDGVENDLWGTGGNQDSQRSYRCH